jgi:hypothetical protein
MAVGAAVIQSSGGSWFDKIGYKIGDYIDNEET